MNVTNLIGVAAAAVFITRLVPQPARLWRSGVADGVSALAAHNAVTAAVAWTVHGVREDLVSVWLPSALALVLAVWTSVLLRRRTTRADVVVAAAWLAVVSAAFVLGHPAPVLAITVLVTTMPQLRLALSAPALTGISPATWWIALADGALWGVYGILLGDAALVGYWVALTACAVPILVRLHGSTAKSLAPEATAT